MKEQMFYASCTGRYFKSTIDKLMLVEAQINYDLIRGFRVTMNDIITKFGFEPMPDFNDIGWVRDQIEFNLFPSVDPESATIIKLVGRDFTAAKNEAELMAVRSSLQFNIAYLTKKIQKEEDPKNEQGV